MTGNLPDRTEIIVIGGGIIGCSTAFHLARDYNAEVLLLECGSLTCGSTWHAAGLVGQLRTSASITRVLKYSVDLYSNLEGETGLATGWKQNGGLRLACNEERWTEIKRQATTAHSFGLTMDLLTPSEAKDLWPFLDPSDLVGAAYLPTDGQANPSDITQSLAKGARKYGATIEEGVKVVAINVHDGQATGVRTNRGTIICEKVVICAGQWSPLIGRTAGVTIPLQPCQHQYVVTEPIDGLSSDLPTLRDPDRRIYFKEEVGGLVFGGYEENPIPWNVDSSPEGFEFQLLEDNWDHFGQHMEQAIERVPALETAGIKTMTNGPEAFTPDGNFILGEAPEAGNVFVGAGFNAYGIAAGGGAGWVLADWVITGEQPLDLWGVDIRRFSGLHQDADWVCERTLEAYGKHYAIAFPHEEYESGRPRITSALYDRLKTQNAVFGSKLGWERPNWFAPAGTEPADRPSFGRSNWFDAVGAEHQAVRERVGLFDQSSFAKFQLQGPDAAAALSWICANQINKPVGRLTYTQMLNSRAGIECDLTVARLHDDLFYLVTGTGFRTHDSAWIRQQMPAGMEADLADVTEDFGTLTLMGPRARQVLEAVTDADLSNAGFPFGHVRDIVIADTTIRALRVTYVGELGWELHTPIDAIGTIYDALMEAGDPQGIANAGYRAIESLRLEKGYRAWGADITPNDDPFQAGLGWAVKLRSNTAFLGRSAAEEIAAAPLTKRLMCFTVDDPNVVLSGRETILRDDAPVGWLTSGGWGYTVQKNIGYGYVRHADGLDDAFLKSGSYTLEVACESVPAEIHFKPLYDPDMTRIKC